MSRSLIQVLSLKLAQVIHAKPVVNQTQVMDSQKAAYVHSQTFSHSQFHDF